jgi:hypothetical protein
MSRRATTFQTALADKFTIHLQEHLDEIKCLISRKEVCFFKQYGKSHMATYSRFSICQGLDLGKFSCGEPHVSLDHIFRKGELVALISVQVKRNGTSLLSTLLLLGNHGAKFCDEFVIIKFCAKIYLSNDTWIHKGSAFLLDWQQVAGSKCELGVI